MNQDCYDEDGAPVKCWKCGSVEQREEVRNVLDAQGQVCEYEIFCAECGTCIGYWAYGYFDPSYAKAVTTDHRPA